MRVLDELGPREEASDGAHEWHHGSCSRARPVLTKRVTTAIFVIRQVAQRSPRVGNWLVWAVLFGGWAADLKARTHEPARITKSSMWTAATAALQQRRHMPIFDEETDNICEGCLTRSTGDNFSPIRVV